MAIREMPMKNLASLTYIPSIPYMKEFVVTLLEPMAVFDMPLINFSAQGVKGLKVHGGTTPFEETGRYTRHYAQGVIKESGKVVCRRVCAVRRDTLHPIASGNSDVDGRFRLEWVGYSGKVVILIFDDATDALDYNCKVFDLVESIY